MPDERDTARELLTALREIIRLALGAISRWPLPRLCTIAPQRRPRRARSLRLQQAMGPCLRPHAGRCVAMEIVIPWLAWLRREEGEQALQQIMAWSMGAPIWRLSGRERCSDRTRPIGSGHHQAVCGGHRQLSRSLRPKNCRCYEDSTDLSAVSSLSEAPGQAKAKWAKLAEAGSRPARSALTLLRKR